MTDINTLVTRQREGGSERAREGARELEIVLNRQRKRLTVYKEQTNYLTISLHNSSMVKTTFVYIVTIHMLDLVLTFLQTKT